ncbi:MAG: UDP-3-O-acyl-N-acetylglucosamine deacetylase [Deltaproteobacteria bacterium]|nr:UDP-3-O-acyl-N-acetylglucosamine deacetylase [Deltaproteobacteria bacterium]
MISARFKKIVTFEGAGVHTGSNCLIALHHAIGGQSGLVSFVRDGRCIAASPSFIQRSRARATVLDNGILTVSTVEHLLFALQFFKGEWRVELTASEIPIMDGSALPFASALMQSGIPPRAVFFDVPVKLEIIDGASHAIIRPCAPNASPIYTVDLVFPSPMGSMSCSVVPMLPEIIRQLSPARTFVLEAEIDYLKSVGLIKGGSLDCALVIGKNGPINTEGMRFPNEPARHKMLDFLGDMSLLGALPRAHIHIQRPGHHINHVIIEHLTPFVGSL